MDFNKSNLINSMIVINGENGNEEHVIIEQQEISDMQHIIKTSDGSQYYITLHGEVPQPELKEEQTSINEENPVEEHVEYENFKDDGFCAQCQLSFPTELKLEEHCKACHGKYRCEICLEEFKTKRMLMKHSKVHKEIFKCEVCDKGFEKRMEIKKHWKQYHASISRFICEFCPEILNSRQELYYHHVNTHMTAFKPLKFIPCKKCLMSFRDQEAYNLHQLYHQRMEEIEEGCIYEEQSN